MNCQSRTYAGFFEVYGFHLRTGTYGHLFSVPADRTGPMLVRVVVWTRVHRCLGMMCGWCLQFVYAPGKWGRPKRGVKQLQIRFRKIRLKSN